MATGIKRFKVSSCGSQSTVKAPSVDSKKGAKRKAHEESTDDRSMKKFRDGHVTLQTINNDPEFYY